ncbi:cupin-like domain-containing protein [Nostoc sp. PA-18-2419]|uniref:cupin-like domain-containing protein n=1 Tax=Nostoc sp. PA-18-2419 TaxID=2575443 RepID=UPI001107E343|nr:cupin-like domain-containing protein [Nostoc sp. PA-18-2419]
MLFENSNSILKIKNPSQKEFIEAWRQYQPFLIDGIVESWNACKDWSNDYLLKKCENNIIPVEFSPKSYLENYEYVLEKSYKQEEMKLKDYIDIISRNKKEINFEYYMAQLNFEKYFPQLTGDINYPKYFSIKPLINFWFGSSGRTTTLHFDLVHNIFAQIRGRKRILMFPPFNYLSLYPPLGESGTHAHFSKVNPINLDLELFPKFPWKDKIEVILQAEEMLYIPPGWWHHVTALDENISLSFWYDIKIKDFFLQKRLLSTSLNILPHYIFHSTSSITIFKSFIESIW